VSVVPAFEQPPDDGGSASILLQLQAIFRDVLNVVVPSPDADLIETGLLDSLALVELLFEIEQRFGVDLALEDLDIENFRTLERLAAVVDGHDAATGSRPT
jgi:D-alanine--poly(phosphoribitol) ligase subunit 2